MKIKTIYFSIFYFPVLFWIHCTVAWGMAKDTSKEETMLMFIGEDLRVISIASKSEEGTWKAPAVAQVITRKEIIEQGFTQLSQVLERIPGFYMAKKEWGSRPYLRAIPESILILYDSIPIASSISKSFTALDNEISLAAVKRIEVIKGPGSVLWGADAFAGIVNIVPVSAVDQNFCEVGGTYESFGDFYGEYANLGYVDSKWNGSLSLSHKKGFEDERTCNMSSFWGNSNEPLPPKERYQETRPGASEYLEFNGKWQYEKWIRIFSRLSKSENKYSMANLGKSLIWKENRDNLTGIISIELQKQVTYSTSVRFNGFHIWSYPHLEIIDNITKQKEKTVYGELIVDQDFFNKDGMLTMGLSHREKKIENALIWIGDWTEYLVDENLSYFPIIREEDYDNKLLSVFGQYKHHIGDADFWIGGRYDKHDAYKDHVSFSSGAAWSPTSSWVLKALYGTAYRTPLSRQLVEEAELDLEKLQNYSLQFIWRATPNLTFDLCSFINQIDNHIMEHHAAGLSIPNQQKTVGTEMEIQYNFDQQFEIFANLTIMDHSGPEEKYTYNDHITDAPGLQQDDNYAYLSYRYDAGPETLSNLGVTWRPYDRMSIHSRIQYIQPQRLLNPSRRVSTDTGEVYYEVASIASDEVWRVNSSLNFFDLGIKGLDLSFILKNATNQNYRLPGTYTLIEGDPISLEIVARHKW